MNDDQALEMLKALSDKTRLGVFNYLRNCCCCTPDDATPTVADVCCSVTGIDKANPKMSFHLKVLKEAGLIHMERQGRHFCCSVNRDAVQKLTEYLALPEENPGENQCQPKS